MKKKFKNTIGFNPDWKGKQSQNKKHNVKTSEDFFDYKEKIKSKKEVDEKIAVDWIWFSRFKFSTCTVYGRGADFKSFFLEGFASKYLLRPSVDFCLPQCILFTSEGTLKDSLAALKQWLIKTVIYLARIQPFIKKAIMDSGLIKGKEFMLKTTQE